MNFKSDLSKFFLDYINKNNRFIYYSNILFTFFNKYYDNPILTGARVSAA